MIFLFTLWFIISNALLFNLRTQVSIYYFFSFWGTSSSISYTRGWSAGNEFPQLLFIWKRLYFASILGVFFHWIWNSELIFSFPFSTLKILFHYLLAFLVLRGRLAAFWNAPLYIPCWLSLAAFKIVSWIFSRLIMMGLRNFRLTYLQIHWCLWSVLCMHVPRARQ